MEKAPKSRDEIERLVLAELQGCGGCEKAAGISIILCESFCDGRFEFGPN